MMKISKYWPTPEFYKGGPLKNHNIVFRYLDLIFLTQGSYLVKFLVRPGPAPHGAGFWKFTGKLEKPENSPNRKTHQI